MSLREGRSFKRSIQPGFERPVTYTRTGLGRAGRPHSGDRCAPSQSGRPITLRFLSLAEHLDVILSAREVCESVYAADPDSRGMALLAGQFTDTDRIDYLDKA